MKTIRVLIFFLVAEATQVFAQAQTPILNSYLPARPTVYLDFDGQLVAGTLWNWSGPIDAQPSGLTNDAIYQIFEYIALDFYPFQLNITTDSAVYNRAPITQRVRIIFTTTNDWYGNAAGVACVGSFSWGNETPAWVFNELLGNTPKYVAACASHEIGHTLGLLDQSSYDEDGNMISEYASGGSQPGSCAAIMGVNLYSACNAWQTRATCAGSQKIQNDLETITSSVNGIGFRTNSRKSGFSNFLPIHVQGQHFAIQGLINLRAEQNIFRLLLPTESFVSLSLQPLNVGAQTGYTPVKVYDQEKKIWVGRFSSLETNLTIHLNAGLYNLILSKDSQTLKQTGSAYFILSGKIYALAGTQEVASDAAPINASSKKISIGGLPFHSR